MGTAATGTPTTLSTVSVTSLYSLEPYILLPQLTQEVCRQALRVMGRDFCQRTSLWREALTSTLTAGNTSATITLSATTDATIGRIVKITIDDGTDYWKTLRDTDYSLDDSGVLSWLYYEPKTGDVMAIEAAILPNLSCYLYPLELVRDWGTAIINGATAHLLESSQMPYSNAKDAAAYRAKYEAECHRAARGTKRRPRSFFSSKPAPLTNNTLPGSILARGGYRPKQ